MTEIYNKRYLPVGEATFDHIVFRQVFIPVSELTVDVAFISNDLTANFQGASRQAFKVLTIHDGGGGPPTVDVTIEEFVPDGNLVDPFNQFPALGAPHGRWAQKAGLGVGVAQNLTLFEHNTEDTMRWARIVLIPRTLLPDVGIRVILEGLRKL